MANELTTAEKATLDDETHHAFQVAAGYTFTSSDESVATVADIDGYWYVIAQSEGTATIDGEASDGSTGSLEVTVIAEPDPNAPGTFTILLGAISAK